MSTPIPQSVHDRAKKLAEVYPLYVVAQLIGHWPSVVTTMKKRGWKAADYSCLRRPRPNDFAIQANHMNTRELAAHYGTTDLGIIVRWRRELRG